MIHFVLLFLLKTGSWITWTTGNNLQRPAKLTVPAPIHFRSHRHTPIPCFRVETHKSGIELCLKKVFHDGISVLVSQEYLEGLNYGSGVNFVCN